MAGRAEFRKSQGVVPFGVGAIIDFPDDSLMMAGLDAWPVELATGNAKSRLLNASRIIDGRLARRLSVNLGRKIDFFLSPTDAPEPFSFGLQQQDDKGYMPFVRFPNWHFCPRCRVLTKVPWNAQIGDASLRCSNPGRRVEGTAKTCAQVHKNRRARLAPVRFVVACKHGHLSDFPWNSWAHHKKNAGCVPGPSDLYLYSTPAAGLAGVVVHCVKCGSKNSLAGAFQKDAMQRVLGELCAGERPWLGPDAAQLSCPSVPQTIQRGASNAYFAKVISSILIPPYSLQLRQALDRPDIWDVVTSVRVDGKIPDALLKVQARNLGFEEDVFKRAVYERLDDEGVTVSETHVTEESYRRDEFRAFLGARPPKDERLDYDKLDKSIPAYGDWFARVFDRVVLVTKLRETRVLTGFSRIVPPEAVDGAVADLAVRPKPWLPASEVRGEGIFLVFSATALARWENEDIKKRSALLQRRLDLHRHNRDFDSRKLSPALVLIHTFAHLLIRQLAFESGYDSSDLRERLYVSTSVGEQMHGVLVYTASGDAEGTLGGLVRQGEPSRLPNTTRAALENASMCSSDPLCAESTGQGVNSLNLACCHACGLLPETSCEEGNLLLDRGLVVGTPEAPALGYFREILDS